MNTVFLFCIKQITYSLILSSKCLFLVLTILVSFFNFADKLSGKVIALD